MLMITYVMFFLRTFKAFSDFDILYSKNVNVRDPIFGKFSIEFSENVLFMLYIHGIK